MLTRINGLFKSALGIGLSLVFLALVAPALAHADSSYGSGGYGACEYGNCSITLTSSGSVSLNVSPTSSGACTIASDTATVHTYNTGGYVLTMANTSTDASLKYLTNSIGTESGTAASPLSLSVNTWGWRVDGLSGFGAGPITAQSNISIPATSFAGIPISSATPVTLASTSVAADPAVSTNIWYGVCIDTSKIQGTYASSVLYTATAN